MKKVIAVLLVLSLVFVIGCAKEPAPSAPAKVAPGPAQAPAAHAEDAGISAGVSAEDSLNDVEADLAEIESLDEDLDLSDLDALDEELNFEI